MFNNLILILRPLSVLYTIYAFPDYFCLFLFIFAPDFAAAKSLQLCPILCGQMDRQQPTRLFFPWDSLGKNTRVGCHFLLLFIFTIYKSVSVQFSSVAQSCPIHCNPMDCSIPGLRVYRQLLEFSQTHVHWVCDAMQPSHPLSFPSPPALNISQDQGLFQWVCSLIQVAKVLDFHLQHQSFQWIFRIDFL